MSEPYIYASNTSDCCGAPVYDDSDICSDCKEHCTVIAECEKCDGKGEYDEEIKSTRDLRFPYKRVKCEECNGEGWVEL